MVIVNDILDYSKIEAGKLEVAMEKYPLGKIIDHIDSMMRSLATEKGLSFEVICGEGLPAIIQTDSNRVHQCLINLVNNAIKFTDQGHVNVKVFIENTAGKPFIHFDVEDTGIGVPPDMQEHIFGSFAQVENGRTRKYGGTGLGLTITNQLAQLLGGELTLISQPGKGSTFSLAIPAGVDVTKEQLLDIRDQTEMSQQNDKFGDFKFTGRVLVAEDVKTNQILIKTLLVNMGADVTIVEDGDEAVEEALNHEFDLIFMDIQMPRMNGYDATKALKKAGMTTPIVALTATAMKGDEEKCLEAGCDGYLAKPIDQTQLVELLSKYLPSKVV